MNEDASNNFGILIAYLIPGATVLLGCSLFSPLLQSWFSGTSTNAPTIGGFLYLTVASLAAGMTVNALRWAILDTTHARTGLPLPKLNFSRLGPNVDAFNLLISIHYWHYQHYSNEFIAVALAYTCYRVHLGEQGPWGWFDIGVLLFEIILFTASRDTLNKYHRRSEQLLSQP